MAEEHRESSGPDVIGVHSRSPLTQVVIGLIVVALGVLFTLDNLGVFPAGAILRWWPVLLIAYGVSRMTGVHRGRSPMAGILFLLLGGLLTLRAAGALAVDPWDFWPVILIALGGSMVAGSLRRSRPGVGPTADPASVLSTFVVFSGLERTVSAQDFRGGDVTVIMGGAEIDLRSARMSGGNAVVNVSVLWGGVDFYVPADWKVTVEALPLLAGIEDGAHPPAGETRGHLVIRGAVIMGGVEIKN